MQKFSPANLSLFTVVYIANVCMNAYVHVDMYICTYMYAYNYKCMQLSVNPMLLKS